METIITHNGIFHADEVVGVALIELHFGEVGVTRTRQPEVIEKGQGDPAVFVIDVGEVFDPGRRNFDHHQNTSLPSSAGMLWDYLCEQNDRFAKVKVPLQEMLMNYLDAVDTNRDNFHHKIQGLTPSPLFFHQVIKGYNRQPGNDAVQLEQFLGAVNMTKQVLENAINSGENILKAEKAWEEREMITEKAAYFREYCPQWKSRQVDELLFPYAILPNPQGYALQTVDTEKYPIPDIVHPDLVFRHKAGFLAIFSTLEAAQEVALSL